MKKFLSIALVALAVAGFNISDAKAQSGAPWYGQASFTDAVVAPGVAVVAVGGTFLHLLLNANVKDGSLRAKADPVRESFEANAKQFQGAPAYAFVDTGSAVASARK